MKDTPHRNKNPVDESLQNKQISAGREFVTAGLKEVPA